MTSTSNTTIIPTILCGGAGTRLWPLSRDHYPKQLLTLAGNDTMLQSTVLRMKGFQGRYEIDEMPIVICNEDHRFLVAQQVKQIAGKAQIILEPCGRNTAPALTIAALHASRNAADPILLVMPADHVIEDQKEFHKAINKGLSVINLEAIVTFGIVPTSPETGYGYIQAEMVSDHSSGVFPVKCFVEKPDRKTAEQYLACGGYCWNSGMFMMRASVWLQAMAHFQKEMLAACKTAYEKGSSDQDFQRIDRVAFTQCPSNSIDYAVMEKLTLTNDQTIQGRMVPLDAGWSDVGAWDAVWSIAKKDANGNATTGDVLLEDSRNSLVWASSRLVSCIGIDKLVVVETPDAILVANKEKVQDVKKIATAIKNKGRSETTDHRKVHRPWGWYDSLDHGQQFQVKRILVNPGAILSLQKHNHRAEHWIVVQGSAKITLGEEVLLLTENQSVFIPQGAKHRVENPGNSPLEIIEVQYGFYLGEDDIIRFDDRYGRNCEV
jgi:mannose-1-phosphate guanylyltransferase / mannose-6-phosphate isomerase